MDRPRPADDEGSIVIRVTLNGKRHTIRGIGRYSDAIAFRRAEIIADTLWADILSNRVLPDIAMYSPSYKLKGLTFEPKVKEPPRLIVVWDKFTASKENAVCENTLQRYETTTRAIVRLKLDSYKWQLAPIKEAITSLKLDNRKRVTKHLIACSLWAWHYGYIDSHLLAKLKLDESKSTAKPQAKPFTAQQRDDLLVYMSQHEDYKHYAPITLFMFHTGCRPCEAVALQWGDVDLERRQLTLGRSVVYLSNGTTQHRPVSKTGNTRVFPFNKAITSLFGDMPMFTAFQKPEIVFKAKQKGYIKFDNYRRRAWKHCVEHIGLNSALMTPYSMRDTFITLALDKGYAVRDIAKLCDNSPDIIYRHYAGWVREVSAMDI